MRFVLVDEIIVPPNRVRRDFDLQEELQLVESITSQGLFHPILLRSDGKTLVAGERRLRAAKLIYGEAAEHANGGTFRFDGQETPSGHIPCVSMDETDAVGVLEAELNENLRRQQLTWQEQAACTSALHKLRVAQDPTHTRMDTAQEVLGADSPVSGPSFAVVREDLEVAEHLADPEVASAGSRKEAAKIIAKRKEDSRRKRLAAEFGVVAQSGNATLIRGDLFEVIPTLAEASFDLLIADPPYGVNAGEWQNQSAVQHSYEDKPEQSNVIYKFLATDAQRVFRNEAHAYLFCDARRFEEVRAIFSAAGWRVWPWPLIWWRGTTNGLVPWPEHGPRRTFDCLCFAIKGNRRVNCIRPDVLAHTHDSTVEYGAHKPVGLYQDLIQRSCVPGNRVLDPCCGTGPVLDAAKREHVWVTAIEIDESAHGQAVERLRKL